MSAVFRMLVYDYAVVSSRMSYNRLLVFTIFNYQVSSFALLLIVVITDYVSNCCNRLLLNGPLLIFIYLMLYNGVAFNRKENFSNRLPL